MEIFSRTPAEKRYPELLSAAPVGDRASVLMKDVDEGGVEAGVGLEDFFNFGGLFVEFAASDSELVTIGFPWAACWRILARRFLNQTYIDQS